MIEIIFLGTSAMAPTKYRQHSSIFVRRYEQNMLFDCGEGTQRQLKLAGISPQKINKIFISHWHGDHVLGIPGLMQTMAANGYCDTLKIFGPKGTSKKIKELLEIFSFDAPLDYEAYDIKEGIVYENKDFKVSAYELKHSIKCFGYRFEEKDQLRIDKTKLKKQKVNEGPHLNELLEKGEIKVGKRTIKAEDVCRIKHGKSFGYVADTILCDNAFEIARNVDLLICESTYCKAHANKAEKYMHLTSEDAAQIALNSNAKKLILTHFSQRYLTTEEILREAREIFDNTSAAYDLMKVKL